MNRKISNGRSFLSLISLITWLLSSGCAHNSVLLDPPAIGPSNYFETSPAFKKALKAEPGSADFERARIDYLLERIGKSPYNFFRNGTQYSGQRARVHLRWKYFLNRAAVKTAEDFISQVATRSKMSGQSYLVEFPDKHRFSLDWILVRELKLLDQALQRERNRLAHESETN